MQQLSNDLYGIVNHGTDKSVGYLFNERVGYQLSHCDIKNVMAG